MRESEIIRAPAHCSSTCFDSTDCNGVEICRAIAEVYGEKFLAGPPAASSEVTRLQHRRE